MKKKRPLQLLDPVFTFDDTAIAMMRTHDYAYQTAILLNEAYRLQLTRIKDIYIGDTPHPCFFYHDEPAWLVYILIARPQNAIADPAFAEYSRMLLIRGRDSWDFQQRLYDDIHSRHYGIALGPAAEPDPTDLLEHLYWERFNRLAQAVTDIDIYGFGRRAPVSTLRLANSEPTLFPVEATTAKASENRAIASYHKTLQNYLNQTFEALHIHLSEENELAF